MEILLSLSYLQDRLNFDNKKLVITALMKGYEIKKLQPHLFKGIGFETNVLSRYKIISGMEKLTFNKEEIYNEKLIDSIDKKSLNYLK